MEDKLYMAQFMKTVKIPFSQRLQSGAMTLFGGFFAGLAMMLVSPFNALRHFFITEHQVVDFSKVPVQMGQAEGDLMQHQMMSNDPGEMKKQILDIFDVREEWKKEHDKEYGHEEEESDED